VCWHLRIADRIGFKAVILLTGHYALLRGWAGYFGFSS
jgi:hypothetical protein